MQWLTHHHEVHQRFLKTSPYLAHSFCHNSPHCLLSTLHSSDSLKNYLGPLSENNPLINFTSHLSRAILRYQNLKWNVRQGRTNIVYYLYVESLTSQTHSKVVVTRDWRVGDMVKKKLTGWGFVINFLHLLFSLLSSLEIDNPTSSLLTWNKKFPASFKVVCCRFHWESVSKGTYITYKQCNILMT